MTYFFFHSTYSLQNQYRPRMKSSWTNTLNHVHQTLPIYFRLYPLHYTSNFTRSTLFIINMLVLVNNLWITRWQPQKAAMNTSCYITSHRVLTTLINMAHQIQCHTKSCLNVLCALLWTLSTPRTSWTIGFDLINNDKHVDYQFKFQI